MAKTALSVSLDSVSPVVSSPVVSSPAPAPIVSRVVTLAPTAKTSAPAPAPALTVKPSAKALTFNYAGLFSAALVAHAFNETLVKQALNGRVSEQFILLALDAGLDVPVKKADFETYTRLFLTSTDKPMRAHGRAIAFGNAFALMRECMALPLVKCVNWAKPAKPAKPPKAVHNMGAEALAIVARVRDAELSNDDLKALIAAIQAQMVAA